MNTHFNSDFQFFPSDEGGITAMEERLWNYIDGFANGEEKTFVEKLIAENIAWRNKYNELMKVHHLLDEATELDQPSLRFTQNVMEQISQHAISPATKNYINKNIIYGIAAFFLTLITGFLVYGFSQVNWSDGNTGTFGFDFGKINFSKVFNNTYMNIFMMLNIVVGLMLLDRFLASRRNEWKNTNI